MPLVRLLYTLSDRVGHLKNLVYFIKSYKTSGLKVGLGMNEKHRSLKLFYFAIAQDLRQLEAPLHQES